MEDLVNRATQETNTGENWGLFIEICERADRNEAAARETVSILTRRLQHRNVNVVLFTLTLANSLVQNCSMTVRQEISSRAFVDSLVRLVSNNATHQIVRTRILELIQQWAALFKEKPSLGFMVDTFNQLKAQNYQFPSNDKKPASVKPQSIINKEKEEEELQLAMALSLSAQETAKKSSTSKSAQSRQPETQPVPARSEKIVRALYDFAGLDEGELRLQRGDVVTVYDDTTFKDWWKGELNGRIGIFPSNYVERLEDQPSAASGSNSAQPGDNSDSGKVDEFLLLLGRTDPRQPNHAENDRIQQLYHDILLMRPKLIRDLEQKKARHDEMVSLNERFTAACGTYHQLMEASLAAQRTAFQAPPMASYGYGPSYPQQPIPMQAPPAQAPYGYNQQWGQ